MVSSVRTCAFSASWLRRPGSGTLLGTTRTVPSALRSAEHVCLCADYTGAVLPSVAPPDALAAPQTAGDHDPEKSAASPDFGRLPRGVDARPVPGGPRGNGTARRRRRQGN